MSHGFLHSALVFLGCAVLFVPLAHRFGLGSVLGYLVGGLVIGPWGLKLITNVEDILHFSEFGVVLFLFLIGLELEPKKLWQMRLPIFGLGAAQVSMNAVLIMVVGILIGWSWQASLIAGLGFSLSSTAIALQILKEKNLLSTQQGHSAFSILLFQDIAVIPMLAILPLLTVGAVTTQVHSGSTFETATSILKVLGVLSIVVIGGRFLLRPIMRAIAAAHLREIFTAFALLLVVAMAVLMQWMSQWVSLSMGLGAFIAGVLLADSEYRHALETDIEPFKGLLLGLFFISVGMSIDLGVLTREPGVIIGLTFGILTLKFLVHVCLGFVFGVQKEQLPFFGLLIAQVGEFAFVLFAAAKVSGVLSEDQTAPLVASSAISMFLSPLLNFLYERFLEPKINQKVKPDSDTIENIKPTVLIAGFGRYGQIVGRMLYANGITATVLDYEPEQIELLRRFGFKVYYGDATRLDLLHSAGALDAKVLVVALDGVEDSLRLIDIAKKEFPHLKIFSRVRNVQHLYNVMDREIAGYERETFESSLRLAGKILTSLGWPAHAAWRATNNFRRHNYDMIQDLHKVRNDSDQSTALVKQARIDLEKMFEKEKARLQSQFGGWDASP